MRGGNEVSPIGPVKKSHNFAGNNFVVQLIRLTI